MGIMNPYDLLKGNKVVVRGFNGALATTYEHVNPASLVFQWFSTAVTLKVASGSAADTNTAGTGMRTCRVVGCDSSGNVITEDFTLAGTTSTAAGTATFRHVYGVYGLTYGTGYANAGIVYVASSTATFTSGNPATPEEVILIPIGENSSQAAVFMAPPSSDYTARKIVIGGAVQPIIVGVYVYDVSALAPSLVYKIPMGSIGLNTIDMRDFPLGLSAGQTVRIDALSTTAAGQVSVDLILEKNY